MTLIALDMSYRSTVLGWVGGRGRDEDHSEGFFCTALACGIVPPDPWFHICTQAASGSHIIFLSI